MGPPGSCWDFLQKKTAPPAEKDYHFKPIFPWHVCSIVFSTWHGTSRFMLGLPAKEDSPSCREGIPCQKSLSLALLLDSFQHMTWDLQVHAGTSCKRKPPAEKGYHFKKEDGSHEPECIHVLGLRVKTFAIGKRTFFLCIVRAYRLSEGTWSTVHKKTTNAQRYAWKTSLEDSTYFPCYQSAVWSGKCRVWSVEWKV